MDKIHYIISDAAKELHVEAHVLRYWEEELALKIPRNNMGQKRWSCSGRSCGGRKRASP